MRNQGPKSIAAPGVTPWIVAIGASAGGLEAFRHLVGAIPASSGAAYILVQHLDPTHPSMIVELLSGHSNIPVLEALDRAKVEADHVYVIPPGALLTVVEGAFSVSQPKTSAGALTGARLPFDALLNSLAETCGSRTVAVTLSGNGSDGALGVETLTAHGGFAIAQTPEEAECDSMPRSSIATGCVDLVLPIADIPAALAEHWRPTPPVSAAVIPASPIPETTEQRIIELVRQRAEIDFRLYKTGTIRRRIQRRIGLAGLHRDDFAGYLSHLTSDAAELDRLASDFLINVTAFFRDPQIFAEISKGIVPEIIRRHEGDGPIRVWVAGCSTGQEAYSLAMIFIEAMEKAPSRQSLQVFASDIDEDAIAIARAGLFPAGLEREVSTERLSRFFQREPGGWRVAADLRSRIVFSVHDVLNDPPFSRLDMVSCRNLLIYFGLEAQARAFSHFHFALLPDGVLLLGSAETPPASSHSFATLSKDQRTYRRVDQMLAHGSDGKLYPSRPVATSAPASPTATPSTVAARLANLCREVMLERFVPPTVLIDAEMECLHAIGDLDPYLKVPSGEPTRSLRDLLRSPYVLTVRAAIRLAQHEKARVSLPVMSGPGAEPVASPILIEAAPVWLDDTPLVAVSFIREAGPEGGASRQPHPPRQLAARDWDAMSRELDSTRAQLQSALVDLDAAAAEQRVANEEALSIQEEYQSTNEELLTSKEELQSLNEELTALNTQMSETLEQQRQTSSDLQNVLDSTNVATLFLDKELRIRFYTPATVAIFNLIASDIGRPLADLAGATDDPSILRDARAVLTSLAPSDHSFETPDGTFFRRRIFPYIAPDSTASGVVITFADVTAEHIAAAAADVARREAVRANLAKSRFLAAASHDLRQPLQTLSLLQGLLARSVNGVGTQRLVARFDETLSAMSGMLNTLLDINQIEAGEVRPVLVDVDVGEVLSLIREEFSYIANAKRLELRIVPSSARIRTDPRLLEQILRNLVANALKYTPNGKVLVGCRHRGDLLRIDVWDTGIGIDPADRALIFEEYHQIDNEARERSKGMGLGLAIVRQLAALLHHPISLETLPGKGSMFAIEAPRVHYQPDPVSTGRNLPTPSPTLRRTASSSILVVEDDPELRELLVQMLASDTHRVLACANGPEALEAVARKSFAPDLILIDYNLPEGMDGIEVSRRLNGLAHRPAAVIVLTGDISNSATVLIAAAGAQRLSKPVKADVLREAVRLQLKAIMTSASTTVTPTPTDDGAVIYIVDDDLALRATLREVLTAEGRTVLDFGSSESFLAAFAHHPQSCLLLDAYLPGMGGLELLRHLAATGRSLPTVVITGNSDIGMAVNAMKAGAVDFVEKPVSHKDLLQIIESALARSRDTSRSSGQRDEAVRRLRTLTPRQKEVMDRVLAGQPSKNIAADLGISQRTVENHRAAIMTRAGVRSLPALARLAVAAAAPPEL